MNAGGHKRETAAAQGRLRAVLTFQRQRAYGKLADGKRGLGVQVERVGCNQKRAGCRLQGMSVVLCARKLAESPCPVTPVHALGVLMTPLQ